MPSPDVTKADPRGLLWAGALVGPWFIVLSLLQAALRPGFNLTKHEVSLLLTGPAGWVQTTTFIITGLFALAFAVGIRRLLHPGRAGTWGPILFALFGLLFIVAGLNHPDPQLGFPIGAPANVPTTQSVPSNIHSAAFSALAICAVAFCFVFTRKFAGDHARGWAVTSAILGVVIVLSVAAGSALMPTGHGGIPLLVAAISITGSVSAIAVRLMKERDRGPGAARGPVDEASTLRA